MPKKLSQRQIIIIGGAVVIVVLFLVVVFLGLRPKANNGPLIKLTVWGTEDQGTFSALAASYPYATVTYKQIDPSDYRSELLSALAAGTGPDVFEISNRELPKWESVLTPLPPAFAQTFSLVQLQNDFPDVVSQDFVSGGNIYGLPLSIDTLVMIYNKDIFNSAGVATPPKTWDDFISDIPQLRTLDSQGNITQSAAAIGSSEQSIPDALDILSLLMLQNGTEMTDSNFTSAQFAASGGPGVAAFNFYLQFANAASQNYTWNDSMGNAIDSFTAGKTAILFGYESDLAAIKTKAPFLNVGVAPMPQPTGATITINYPNYSGFVAAKAGQTTAAWDFILYLTTTPSVANMYLTATGNPPALRTAIQADANDPNLSVFAAQALTAKSWYEADDTAIDSIFNTAILNVQDGAADSTKALNQAQDSVSQLMQ